MRTLEAQVAMDIPQLAQAVREIEGIASVCPGAIKRGAKLAIARLEPDGSPGVVVIVAKKRSAQGVAADDGATIPWSHVIGEVRR